MTPIRHIHPLIAVAACLWAFSPLLAGVDAPDIEKMTPREQAGEMIKYGLLLRSCGQYDQALECYMWAVTKDPDHPLAEKVRQEVMALLKIQAGQRRLLGDPYDLEIAPLQLGIQVLNPEFYQQKIDEMIAKYPDKWEPLAFSAQNQMRLSQFETAVELLDRAIQVGGTEAKLALSLVQMDLKNRLKLNEIKKQAERSIAEGHPVSAARQLEAAWKEDPSRVEFALKAAALFSESHSHEAASGICLAVAAHLKEHPKHPMAGNAGRIQALGEQSASVHQELKKMTRSSKKVATPQKKSSPLDLYKKRTK